MRTLIGDARLTGLRSASRAQRFKEIRPLRKENSFPALADGSEKLLGVELAAVLGTVGICASANKVVSHGNKACRFHNDPN